MTSLKLPELVLIDLDGTLVDSVPDLACSVDRLMLELGLPERGIEEVKNWVGNGIDTLVHRALTNDFSGKADQPLFSVAICRFFEIYAEENGKRSKVYDGVLEGLDFLNSQSCHIACVTNKSRTFTLTLLERMELEDYFQFTVCGDDTAEKKPHPLPLLTAARHFSVKPESCWMIGDSVSDVDAARAAGFQIIAVSYGYNHGVDIRSHAPDAVIDSLADLSVLI